MSASIRLRYKLRYTHHDLPFIFFSTCRQTYNTRNKSNYITYGYLKISFILYRDA